MKHSIPLVYYRIICCCLVALCLVTRQGIGQSTNISGIVNTYHRVNGIIPAKACLLVDNVGALDVNSKVLIIQMKGASIVTTNNSSFGDTTSLLEAGDYEIGTVCYIIGDSVFLFHELLNSYNTATGKVQLVQFAEYYSAIVTDTIKAQAWDNTAGTGGVIAISVDEDLVLNAPVSADSAGYRGGAYRLSGNTCSNTFPSNNYYYNASSTSPQQSGAYKGEGVHDIASNMTGGRGAPANGGGGGNNHNNGGGGGANLAAGGAGGGNSSTVGCLNDYHGHAGKALSSWNGEKIFPGGGGGAGHSNASFTVSYGGGHGGGIVFIHANTITGNGHAISANGKQGGPAVSDGASGGGAGGTIIMDILTGYTGSLSIQARGGNGGNENDGGNSGRCYGAGGGGGGGVIYFTGTLPGGITTNVTGGAAGLELSPDASCNPLVLPAAGAAGSLVPGYTYRRSVSPAGYCALLLPVTLISFSAERSQHTVRVQWFVQHPEQAAGYRIERSADRVNWMQIDAVNGDLQQHLYGIVDENPGGSLLYYRLKVIEKSGRVSWSPVRAVQFSDRAIPVIYPNPASGKIYIRYQQTPCSLKLVDSQGKVILQTTMSGITREIETGHLAEGLYLVQVDGFVQKIIIRR